MIISRSAPLSLSGESSSSCGAMSVQSLRCGRDPKPWTPKSPARVQTQVQGVGKTLLCHTCPLNMVLAVMTDPVIFGSEWVDDFDNFESCRKATGANTVPKCRTASVSLVLPCSTTFGSAEYNMLHIVFCSMSRSPDTPK